MTASSQKANSRSKVSAGASAARSPRMVVGVTSAQTCLVLTGRLRALQDTGFEVTLVSSPGELLEHTAAAEGVTARAIPMKRGIAPFSDVLAFFWLLVYLFRNRPEITDFSTPKAGLLGNLAAWMARVPHRVYTLRGLKLESARGGKRTILLWSEKLAASCAQVVLCNSQSLRTAAIELGIAPAQKLRVLGYGSSNGVDAQRFHPETCTGNSAIRKELKIAESDPVLGYVGRLTRDKGIPELLVAFDQILARVPNCWLLLVGWFDRAEDALDHHWREHIAHHKRIWHTGYVKDTAPWYRAMDALVLATHREGFPNVVLEAAASGVPAITTESTGARDAVVPEVTGFLIPPGRPDAITEAALEMIRDAERRKQMGVAARAWVMEKYSKDHVLGLATEFYRELL